MKNPWLAIPVDEYVGHMRSPEVGQYEILNQLMRDTVQTSRPGNMVVLGCSNGNGFEHIDPAVTTRVVGVDVNLRYLQELARRFPHPPFALDLLCTDLETSRFGAQAFDLVHAALVFEYVDWLTVLPRVAEALRPQGVLSIVLQLPSRVIPAVTPTPFTSLELLGSVFHYVDPDLLVARAAELALQLASRRTEPLRSGKAFEVLQFKKGI